MVPTSLYVDGIAFSENDNLIAFYLVNWITGARHLIISVRKNDLCRCGCRGWCTLFSIHLFLRWTFRATGAGILPEGRHDLKTWGLCDNMREAYAGEELGIRAAVVLVNADWKEFVSTFGLPAHNSLYSPCPTCSVPQELLYDRSSFTPLCADAHPLKTLATYILACQKCELHRVLDRGAYEAVRAKLWYDKRDSGSRGRALRSDVPEANLLKNDRLEPTEFMPDIADFDLIDSFPAPVVFWRPSSESTTRRRCPLVCEELGISPQSLALD